MYYVSMTDNFMSDWGRAEGLINRLVLICDTLAEAETVFDYALSRSEMRRVTISSTPPAYFHRRWQETGDEYETGRYYVSIKTKDEYPRWYRGLEG